jgi:hypothetical protein
MLQRNLLYTGVMDLSKTGLILDTIAAGSRRLRNLHFWTIDSRGPGWGFLRYARRVRETYSVSETDV